MNQPSLQDKLIAISVSENEDLLILGYSVEHLNDLFLRLARALLSRGARLAYGGILGPGNFTQTLHETAKHEFIGDSSRALTPFVNYQAWPWHLQLEDNKILYEQDSCHYVKVDDRKSAGPQSDDELENKQRAAHASSRMRCWMAADASARIIVGGKTRAFDGLIPGIHEEALFHLEAEKPLYIVGGFGGAAHHFAQAILPPHGDLPESLIEIKRRGNVELDELVQAFPKELDDTFPHDVTRDKAERSYTRLGEKIHQIRQDGLELGLKNGLDDDENRRLMTSENANEIVNLICNGLERIL